MNTVMDNQGGVNTARSLYDLTDKIAAHGQLNVIVVSDDEGIHYLSCYACDASRPTTTNDDTPSTAHPWQENYDEQLTNNSNTSGTTLAMTMSTALNDMSAATNTWRGAASKLDDESVHEDRAIYHRKCLKHHMT